VIEIVKVITKKQMKQFIMFPFRLYKDNSCWVPPLLMDERFSLDRKKNPAFEFSDAEYWLAKKDGQLVGRIAGIISQAYIDKWENRYARFGWIDFIDDKDVSKALIDTVIQWAKEHGLNGLHGPLGFCDLDKEGMLVDGFQEMGTFITIYNHAYYKDHMAALGFSVDAEWIEWDIQLTDIKQADTLKKLSDRAKEKYEMRMIPLKKNKDVIPYVGRIFDLLNIGYEHLYATVPVTKKQVDSYVKQFFGFLNVEYISIIVDKNDDICGFGITMPALHVPSQKTKGRILPFGFIHWLWAIKHSRSLDLYLVAVKPELQKTGIPFIMLSELTRHAIKNGITHAVASPELITNTAVHTMWKNYDARIHRRRQAFLKTWENE